MKSFYYLASLAVATTCSGLFTPIGAVQRRDSACTSYSVVTTSYVAVGNDTVEVQTLACDDAVTSRAEPASALSPRDFASGDVCGDICTNVCNFAGGVLPPEADDCAVIVDAITILNGDVPDEFVVAADEVKQLTYQTCRFFFENFSSGPLTYCWSALSDVGSAAASACFPPTQPNYSEGLCQPNNGTGNATWAVGAAHS